MRTKIHVDKVELIEEISRIENDRTFPNRAALYEAVSVGVWAHSHAKPLTSAIIGLRMKEYSIEPNTPKGKRGRTFGPLTEEQKKAMQAGRRKRVAKPLPELRIVTPENRMGLVEKIEAGSKASALKLMCLQCTDYHVTEIKHCPIVSCPLHSIRAYK